ncbi:hypothetical protein EVAR_100174_1 [Eumeta japonica]|uniref:Uncharacterized protein n=1 Tax=Eumeta variegata TaxID=151549 RepID=A0A4C2A4Y5_EUMVA|nr:hypothetical protein EVAR_100174_1 [Eumeta japonica]
MVMKIFSNLRQNNSSERYRGRIFRVATCSHKTKINSIKIWIDAKPNSLALQFETRRSASAGVDNTPALHAVTPDMRDSVHYPKAEIMILTLHVSKGTDIHVFLGSSSDSSSTLRFVQQQLLTYKPSDALAKIAPAVDLLNNEKIDTR